MSLILKASVGAFLASVAFGVLFNIKYEKLWLAGFTGMVGGFVYIFCLQMGWSDVFSNFFATICFTICAEILARTCKTPVTTFIVCALIPLVPGAKMYEMIIEIIKNCPDKALSLFLETLSIAGALAVAILVVETLTWLLLDLKKKVRLGEGK